MHLQRATFGSITIDGTTYDHDVVIDGPVVQARDKRASRDMTDIIGHTPLSAGEPIPWDCKRLLIGTGAHGMLPVMDDLMAEAQERGVELVMRPTPTLLQEYEHLPDDANAIIHVTC